MPTITRYGPYRLHFWSADRLEPAHVHVDRDDKTAKFWVNPVRIAENRHFTAKETRRLLKIVRDHEQQILDAWNRHFRNA